MRWDRGPNEPHQAVLIDFDHSRFHFFFIELWPQEVYYFTGLLDHCLVGAVPRQRADRARVVRLVCPQTVWTDLFMWVEKAIRASGTIA